MICDACGTRFTASEGGGFTFHLLHCDACGGEKSVLFDEIRSIHERQMLDEADPNRLDEEACHAAVEEFAGTCDCGGRFTFEAEARCPKCRSDQYHTDPDGDLICYD